MTITTMLNKQDEETTVEPEKKGRKKKLIVVVLVLVLAFGAWYSMLRPSGSAAAPQPGKVVVLEPIQVNLAAGHYLRIGVALQASTKAKADLDGSKALDSIIGLFSGQPTEKLAKASEREHFKDKLTTALKKEYDGEVIGVYFTDFVTQ